ncbi:MAG: ribonucleotide reductase, partial [Bacteroidota bacterium]
HISKDNLLNFMKFRVDNSLNSIGMESIFFVSEYDYQPMIWFEEEIFSNSLDDFFAKRPVEYTKHDKSITGDDLF